jgi:hypothetical protein
MCWSYRLLTPLTVLNLMAAPTMTGAMNDVLEQREGSIEEYRKGISLDGGGTGAAFFVNRIFQGIELFDRESTFGRCSPSFSPGSPSRR